MKKIVLYASALIIGIALLSAFTFYNNTEEVEIYDNTGIVVDIPEDVQAVIDKSCYGCHNSDSKNQKGKLNLKFDYFKKGEYSAGKVVGKLNKIVETLDEGKMPPSKFLAKYPDKKPTKEEAGLLRKWAADNLKKLTE
jgi:hypothetical protein